MIKIKIEDDRSYESVMINEQTEEELKAVFRHELELGHRLMPTGGCKNFDPQKGCLRCEIEDDNDTYGFKEGEALSDKHWEECRQIAIYDDQLKKAMKLLDRVKAVHAAAIRNGDAAVSALTSRLLYDIEKLEGEI